MLDCLHYVAYSNPIADVVPDDVNGFIMAAEDIMAAEEVIKK